MLRRQGKGVDSAWRSPWLTKVLASGRMTPWVPLLVGCGVRKKRARRVRIGLLGSWGEGRGWEAGWLGKRRWPSGGMLS